MSSIPGLPLSLPADRPSPPLPLAWAFMLMAALCVAMWAAIGVIVLHLVGWFW